MTLIGDVMFWALGVIAVLSGVAVFWVNSMARATYALAISFVAVGLHLLLLDQAYLGVITILMMVMEMAVMAVYMIMFMGMNPALMPMSMVHDKRLSLVIALVTFALLAAGILLTPWPAGSPAPTEGVTMALGEALMESKMLAMIVLSPVMVATIIAGVSLSLHRGRYDRYGDDLKRPKADDPQPGGVGR
ncbi:NADH-quinone oxidoreductase subunit J [Agrococcus sp. KRD186]|jgi:NADH:ubiquinone oxidoreductase subunit 6 (subunit J)|uniref:NADH-quinone oxidoreductase subunit J n=1 Tax=Agrococcus sp. KRD186 TaxID=2729730 RepID=UPI0019CF5B92|nr:NADH-quinone oxidoreductase subunit J [Agrococcus sp. KRD186]